MVSKKHLLVQCVLVEIILNSLRVSDEQKAKLTELLRKVTDDALAQDIMMTQNSQLCLLQTEMKIAQSSFEATGPTVALWGVQ